MNLSREKLKMLISILMESKIYLTLTLTERYFLIKDLGKRYPSLLEKQIQDRD